MEGGKEEEKLREGRGGGEGEREGGWREGERERN